MQGKAALSSLPWHMDHGQSPLFPSSIPKLWPPLRAQGFPGPQNPLWGWKCPDAAHLDTKTYSQAFLAEKHQRNLGRKGGLGTRLGALGCTGRQGKAMSNGVLGEGAFREKWGTRICMVVHRKQWGSWGRGHLAAWPCIGASWGALGCNGMDGSAKGTQGKGASLEKHWSVVAVRGEHLGTAELMIPTSGFFPSSISSSPCRETTKPHWSLVCPQYQQGTSKGWEA